MTFNQARKKAGLTQEGLARELDLTLRTIARYCKGTHHPKLDAATKAREVFRSRGVEWGPEVCPCCGRAL
jgi:DNA-binding XRE family transcriptional regulator